MIKNIEKMMEGLAVYWMKRDFRLADNPALTEALTFHETVVPVYIVEPTLLSAHDTSAFHVHAIFQALQDVRIQFQHHGGDVGIIKAAAVDAWQLLYDKRPFTRLYSHEEIGVNWTYQRDLAVQDWCHARNIEWVQLRQAGIFRNLKSREVRQKRWRKFTFSDLLPKPTDSDLQRIRIPHEWASLFLPAQTSLHIEEVGFSLDSDQLNQVQEVSETAAEKTLESFLYDRSLKYKGGISSPLTAFTAGSRLSVHSAWGTLSARTAYQKAQNRKIALKESDLAHAGRWRSSLTSFISRLHWRDHFIQRLESEPDMEFHALCKAYDALDYENKDEHLTAWVEGHTGFPIVDACIRCLKTTGFLNFRMRALITSVACHTLQLDWRLIHPYMAKMYRDYEPGIHLSQLQMQASVVGINTIRIYSPTKQIIDQDPDTIFIKQWVPELRKFSPQQIQEHTDKPLGDYPPQIVDWKVSSKEMRSKIWAIKKLPETKAMAQEVYAKHGSRVNRGKRTPKAKTKATK